MKGNKTSQVTLLGLLIAFLGVPLVIYLFSFTAPAPYTDAFILKKELTIFLVGILLIFITIKGEGKNLSSIGLHGKHWMRSIGSGIVLAVILLGAIILCAWILGQFGIQVGGEEGQRYESISLWTMTLVTIRAGVVEEICYRGYLMERLDEWSSGNFWIFFMVPVIIFALAHYSQGIAGYVISFVAGTIMAYVYWKKRDLKANIIAHFLADFTPNVLLPLLV